MPNVIEVLPGAEPRVVDMPVLTRAEIRARIVCFATAAAFRIEIDRARWLTGWCDDEGIIIGRPFNFWRWAFNSDPIMGPVYVTRETRDEDGLCVAVEPDDMRLLLFAASASTAGMRVLVPPTVAR